MGFYCGVLRNGIVQGRQVLAEFSSWRDFFFFLFLSVSNIYVCSETLWMYMYLCI